jgi:hypothetical protein
MLLWIVAACLVFCAFFSACKTTKQSTRENTYASSVTVSDAVSATDEKNSEKTKETRTDYTGIDTDIDETIVSTEWSEPDSTGKQYPKTTTSTTRHKRSGKKRILASEKDTSVNKDKTSENNSAIRQKSDYKSEVDEKKEVKSRTPEWIIVGVLACVAGLMVIIYLILKRFGIVK